LATSSCCASNTQTKQAISSWRITPSQDATSSPTQSPSKHVILSSSLPTPHHQRAAPRAHVHVWTDTGGHAWCCVYFRKKMGIRMTGSGLTGVVLLVGSAFYFCSSFNCGGVYDAVVGHRSPLAIRQRQNLSVQSQERRGQSRYPQILHQTRSATCTRLSSHSLPVSSSNRSRRLFRAPSRSEVLQDVRIQSYSHPLLNYFANTCLLSS
jgi:hypothetical protein